MSPLRRRKKAPEAESNDDTEYFFMKSFRRDDGAGISNTPNLSPPMDNWFHGHIWTQPVPEPLLFGIDDDDQGRMLSYFPNFPLMSDALLSSLAACGVDNLNTYQAEIVEHQTGRRYLNYKAVNVIGVLSVVDESKAAFEELGIGRMKFYHRFVMDDSKTHGIKLFRPLEAISNIMVHRSVKEKLLKDSFQDIDFLRPDQFSG